MPVTIPAESTIDSLDAAPIFAVAALMLIPTAGRDLAAVKGLLKTARRCFDPDKNDQDQITLEEAMALYDAVGLTGMPDDESEPLVYVGAILDFYNATLPYDPEPD